MRLQALLVTAASALAFAACTKDNPNYCANAPLHNCLYADAHPDRMEVGDGGDASDAGDATDGPLDAVAEAKPICTTDDQCNPDGGTPACGAGDGGAAACVECTMDKHCAGTKAVCDATAQKCVECTGSDTMDCKGKPGTVCKAATKTCVECTSNAQCSGTKPICDMNTNACRGCAADSECMASPGICVDWDGHCAAAAEVVTVQGVTGCTPSPGLFCRPNDALAARPTNGVLVVKGAEPVGMIEPLTAATPDKILILGRNGGSVAAGAGDLASLHLGGATKFWVRDLKVSGGTIGILADGSTEVHITRCTVVSNPKGGIKTSMASFEITNSIIAGSGPGIDTGGVAWGGVRLGDIPGGGFSKFANNTVVDNSSIGVSCTSSTYDVSTSIVHGNQGGDSVGCSGASCCGPTNPDPKLDANFHLTSGSPCIDQITPSMSTVTVDIDGQPRPTMLPGKLDCGADELVP
jgi:hypothetical protein